MEYIKVWSMKNSTNFNLRDNIPTQGHQKCTTHNTDNTGNLMVECEVNIFQ